MILAIDVGNTNIVMGFIEGRYHCGQISPVYQ